MKYGKGKRLVIADVKKNIPTASLRRRGLMPPHRVKSISMTTFTPDEIEQLRNRGNEYCRYVWLGTYDTNANSLESEVSDEIRKRDFMSQKYEKKRWYVDPEIATKKMLLQKPKQIPETQPLSRLLGRTPTPLVVQNHQPSEAWPHPVSSASAPAISTKTTSYKHTNDGPQAHGSRSIDLLSELAGDRFTSPSSRASTAATTTTTSANGNFANFANFETAFCSGNKDLNQQPFQPSNHRKTTYTPPVGWTSFEDELGSSAVSSPNAATISSEFLSHIGNSSSTMPRPLSLPTFAPTNPFKALPPPTSGTSTSIQWSSFAVSSTTAPGLPTSASLDAYHLKSMQQQQNVELFGRSAIAMPMSSVVPSSVMSEQQSNADRYAALADLDSLFHQPAVTKAPSWTEEATAATVSTSSSYFDATATTDSTTAYSTAPSNPFSSAQLWGQLQVSKSQNSFQPVNPFQNMGSSDNLPYTQTQNSNQPYVAPFPIVGRSPSEEGTMRNQFGSATGFAMFPPSPQQTVMSPSSSNSFYSGQTLLQNGGFAMSPTATSGGAAVASWGATSSTAPQSNWPSSQLGPVGLFSVDHKMADAAQHTDWIQNPVNPFMAPSSSMGFQTAPRHNSSNPFL